MKEFLKKRAVLLITILVTVLFVVTVFNLLTDDSGGAAEEFSEIGQEDIDICEVSSDCIVVPYSHCCGSTKRAINKKYKTHYDKNPSWQKFDDPQACSLIGVCPDDSQVTEAVCEASDPVSRCRLNE